MDGVAVPGKLKLKKGGVNKKKRKDKTLEKKMIEESLNKKSINDDMMTESKVDEDNGRNILPTTTDDDDTSTLQPPAKTKAEMTFARRQAELQAERILKKAQMSHREKVEQFNDKMNEMTEFNDIPKVSWTK